MRGNCKKKIIIEKILRTFFNEKQSDSVWNPSDASISNPFFFSSSVLYYSIFLNAHLAHTMRGKQKNIYAQAACVNIHFCLWGGGCFCPFPPSNFTALQRKTWTFQMAITSKDVKGLPEGMICILFLPFL